MGTRHQVSNNIITRSRAIEPGDASSQTSGTVEVSELMVKKTEKTTLKTNALQLDRGKEEDSGRLRDEQSHLYLVNPPTSMFPVIRHA